MEELGNNVNYDKEFQAKEQGFLSQYKTALEALQAEVATMQSKLKEVLDN